MKESLLNIIELISTHYLYNGILLRLICAGFVPGSFRLNLFKVENFLCFPFVQKVRKLLPPLKPIQPDPLFVYSSPLCLVALLLWFIQVYTFVTGFIYSLLIVLIKYNLLSIKIFLDWKSGIYKLFVNFL